jgi:futalosine hydrolase
MTKRIAIIAATEREIQPLHDYVRTESTQHAFQSYKLHSTTFDLIYSGIGLLQTSYTLMDYLSHHHPDGWIQMGIGGAFDSSLEIGKVYAIESEVLIDFGVEESNGRIKNPFEMQWSDLDAFPFEGGRLECPHISEKISIPRASGMTTMLSHRIQPHIDTIRNNLHGQIENMEGASFFYISLIKKIPFLSIRSISNIVEARDTKKWKIDLAITNLNAKVIELITNSSIPGM